MVARVCVSLALLTWQVPTQQPPVTPVEPRPSATRPAAPASIVPPVLPRDARLLVDQSTQRLLQDLRLLEQQYQIDQRPDDAAAVRAQMKLLLQATGLVEDPSTQTPAPKVYMSNYRDRIGQSFVFTVTGSADEPVWGTSVYTDDTALEGAAVHAGVLRSGQSGEVHVTVLPGQARYEGSKRNGIESMSASAAAGSFRIGSGPPPNMARPTSISGFRGRIGEVLTIPVVGAQSGSVWGTDVYTDDSAVAAAAVHAGVLRVGEFGFVRITMMQGQPAYVGSTRGGIISQNYGEFQGSFQIAAAPQPWAIKLPDDVADGTGMVTLPSLRKEIGISFSVKVTGAAGTIRGSDIYTDDSSIAVAAVHAGVLRLGETGYVRVTILPGQEAYAGSEQNGVKSVNGGKWQGSFRIDKGTIPR